MNHGPKYTFHIKFRFSGQIMKWKAFIIFVWLSCKISTNLIDCKWGFILIYKQIYFKFKVVVIMDCESNGQHLFTENSHILL
jgi:hypothetical protein